MKDIINLQKIRVMNETNKFITDPEVRKFYTYDYYIQLTLSTVNGNSLKKMLKQMNRKQSTLSSAEDQQKKDAARKKRRKYAIADVFFRISHRDRHDKPLSNKEQKRIVQEVVDSLTRFMEKAKLKDTEEISSTYVPYYDALIDEEQYSQVGHKKVSEEIKKKMEEQNEDYQFRPALLKGTVRKSRLKLY